MNLKSVELINFKCFGKAKFSFSPLTFIKGENGTGKTTLALDSLLFALYGFSRAEILADLPTKAKSKKCSVAVEIEHNNTEYIVIREYPTKITVHECNEEEDKILDFTTSMEAQAWINKTFGDRLNFCRFRCIDTTTQDTNFLESGQTTIKRILFAHSDKIFDNLKKKLNSIKSERERFSKDNAITYTHYPSEKRLQLLDTKSKEFNQQENELIKDIRAFNNDFRKIEREVGQLENEKKTLNNQKNTLNTEKVCYACKQTLPKPKAKEMLETANNRIKEINNTLQLKLSEKEDLNDIVNSHTKIREKISSRIQDLIDLKIKLETRIKQKEFKYTKKDIEIVKQAIKEVDNLSSYYLTESIKILEPMINSILDKIGFSVFFETNDKGKFNINLKKGNITYKYKDLSTGQKLLLQIAFKLAILMERNESGTIVADEGMSSLDQENLKHILSIFEDYPFQLLLVLHRFEDVPDNIKVINLNKED